MMESIRTIGVFALIIAFIVGVAYVGNIISNYILTLNTPYVIVYVCFIIFGFAIGIICLVNLIENFGYNK